MEHIFRNLPTKRARVELVKPAVEVVGCIEVKMQLLPNSRFGQKLVMNRCPDLVSIHGSTKPVLISPLSLIWVNLALT